ncbi:hypothetical protein RIF29_39398 [Crotalaria pallida]|uniref:Xylanase inhibitor N-terminal domain-containing protein n=1 Tax=Crotalaria pallida TaxID=3830 RepID=A0AAN9HPK7_CROPI
METVTLETDSISGIAIGCGHNNQGLFTGAASVLGLGGSSLSFPTQLNTTLFSYCLVDYESKSASTLEFDTSFPFNAVTAPLPFNPNYDTFGTPFPSNALLESESQFSWTSLFGKTLYYIGSVFRIALFLFNIVSQKQQHYIL